MKAKAGKSTRMYIMSKKLGLIKPAATPNDTAMEEEVKLTSCLLTTKQY